MGDYTLFDKLLKWVSTPEKRRGELDLSPTDQDLLVRYKFIDDQFRRHRPALSKRQIITIYCDRFNVSERQAYYDIKETQKLYGTMFKDDKDYMKTVQVEWYKQLRSIAEQDGDYMSAVAASKHIDLLLGLLKDDETGGIVLPSTIQIVIKGNESNKTLNMDALQKLPESEFEQILDDNSSSLPDPEQIKSQLDELDVSDDE
jgi:hypothetical protein